MSHLYCISCCVDMLSLSKNSVGGSKKNADHLLNSGLVILESVVAKHSHSPVCYLMHSAKYWSVNLLCTLLKRKQRFLLT